MFFKLETWRKSLQRFREIVPSAWCNNCEGRVTDCWSSRERCYKGYAFSNKPSQSHIKWNTL